MLAGELRTEKEILEKLNQYWNDNDDSKLPPLYHGTDLSLLKMPKEERTQLNEACEVIIDALYKLFKANEINPTDKRLMESRDSYGRSSTAYTFAEARINKSGLYSYGDFYVTNDPKRAISYSQEAWICGETGWIANRLIEGARALDLSLPDCESFKNAFLVFDKRRQEEKDSVVLMIINGHSAGLYDESGDNLKELYEDDFPEEIAFLKKTSSVTHSYRLDFQIDDEESMAYVIKRECYPGLMEAWNSFFAMK